MAFHGIGREIGIINRIALGPVADREDAVLVTGGDAEPVDPVIGCDGAVSFEALGVGRAAGIQDLHDAFLAAGAGHAVVEPLVEIRLMVLADLQLDVLRVLKRAYNDIAAVEGVGNLDHSEIPLFYFRPGICPPDHAGSARARIASSSIAAL